MASCWLDNQEGEITMSTPNEDTNIVESPIFEPFPEPNTMPSGWDLSGLTPDPVPAPADLADDMPEN
jgi:hypothetical protein